GEVVDGNDPIASWHAMQRAMEFCRHQRRPYLLEGMVSRLYGHSSSSGAMRHHDEPDCIALFEDRLLRAGMLTQEASDQGHHDAQTEVESAVEQAMSEPRPQIGDIPRFYYAASSVDAVYPEDYFELPS